MAVVMTTKLDCTVLECSKTIREKGRGVQVCVISQLVFIFSINSALLEETGFFSDFSGQSTNLESYFWLLLLLVVFAPFPRTTSRIPTLVPLASLFSSLPVFSLDCMTGAIFSTSTVFNCCIRALVKGKNLDFASPKFCFTQEFYLKEGLPVSSDKENLPPHSMVYFQGSSICLCSV